MKYRNNWLKCVDLRKFSSIFISQRRFKLDRPAAYSLYTVTGDADHSSLVLLWYYIKCAHLYPSRSSIVLYLTCQSFPTPLPSPYGRSWDVDFHSRRSIKTFQVKEGKKEEQMHHVGLKEKLKTFVA